MALSPTQKWLDTVKGGTAEPVLLFEFRPTVLRDEKNFCGDWVSGTDSSGISLGDPANIANLDTAHPTDELRLAGADVESPEKQLRQDGGPEKFYLTYEEENKTLVGGTWTTRTNIAPLELIQVVKFDSSFHLKKLCLGLYNRENKSKALLDVSLLTNFRNPREVLPWYSSTASRDRSAPPGELGRIFAQAEVLARKTIDLSLDSLPPDKGGPVDGKDRETDPSGRNWRILDFSADNVWLPGGGVPCAIVVQALDLTDIRYLELKGSNSRQDYSRGNLYTFNAAAGVFVEPDACLSFKLIAQGYAATGSGIWTFDVGSVPAANLAGEAELSYCEPDGTNVVFQMRQADQLAEISWKPWKEIVDGAAVNKRFIQMKTALSSGATRLDTPRIYSLRVAFKASHKFLLAARPLFGYPNLVAEPPDYSAEGEPLSGEASATDTSRIVLIDAGGMVRRIFSLYNLKNDEIRIYLGFDVPGFHDSGDTGYNQGRGDWLPFKAVWIEDWEIEDGRVVVHSYDQQVRFKEAYAPSPNDPPDMTEHIHYDLMNPAEIKKDLLRRARIRPAGIDSTSFATLRNAFPWQLSHTIEKPSSLQKVDLELNKHLLAFQVVDETGKWTVKYVDYAGTAYDPVLGLWKRNGAVLPCLSGDDLVLASERFSPGRKYMRNVAVIFFGGKGTEETDYRCLAVDYDQESEKEHKEYAVDKILSEFIPASVDKTGIPLEVARRRLNLQKDGVRTIEFATRLEFAGLQIGDHVNLTSALYSRPLAADPNPLLVMLTRKNIDSSLAAIHWAGFVLLDAGQSAGTAQTVNPPRNVTVTANGNGTVSWAWDKSLDDLAGSGRGRYELYQRPSQLETWGVPKTELRADGSDNYSRSDTDFTALIAYDFGVKYINENGRASAIITAEPENLLVTAAAPPAPGAGDWSLLPLDGAIKVYLINDVDGAHHYNVWVRPDASTGWRPAGIILAGKSGTNFFVFTPPDPYSGSDPWFLFCLSAVDSRGRESAGSAPKIMCYRQLMGPGEILTAPGFDSEGGVYPLVSRVAVGSYYAFSITLKILAPAGQEDMVDRFELERRDDQGTNQAAWSEWQRLPEFKIKQDDSILPGPQVVYYDNTDRKLKPGRWYQYRARAVGRNNIPGTWSQSTAIHLTDDSTPPDKPTVTVTEHTGHNLVEISTPSIAGGPCPDFSHFQIEGSENGGAWIILEHQWRNTIFVHTNTDINLEKNWSYRVTAYDHSGNSSPVSDPSENKKQKQASSAFLGAGSVTNEKIYTGAVTANKIAANTITAAQIAANTITAAQIASHTITASEIASGTITTSELNFTPIQSSNVIASINASAEGITISGARLHISNATVFDSDVVIQGLLSAAGGIKTSISGTQRLELGTFDGQERLRCYSDGSLAVDIYATSQLGAVRVYSKDLFSYGTTYEWRHTGWFSRPFGSACLIIPDSSILSRIVTWQNGDAAPVWDNTNKKFKIYVEGDTTYTFEASGQTWLNNINLTAGKVYKIDTLQVVGARGAAVADSGAINASSNDADAAKLSNVQSLRSQFNTLLARLRAHGLIAT